MAVLIVKSFINYFGLRNGCIIIGILGIFGRLIFGLGDAIVFISYKGIFDEVDDFNTLHIAVCLTNGLVGIAAAATLLHGAFEGNKKTIKIYLFIAALMILLIFISMCIGIVTLHGSKLRHLYQSHSCDYDCQWTVSVSIYVLVFDVIDLICYLYFWICARSFYYELHENGF